MTGAYMKTSAQLLCLSLLTALLSGCALTTDQIDLRYNPRGAREKVPGAEAVKVATKVTDLRDVRERVGKKINGFGMEMAAIVSRTDVAELMRGAIETELDSRGFAHGDSVVISCELNRLYNRFKPGFWSGDSVAEVIFGVQIKSADGQVLFSKNVIAEGLEPNIQVAAGHNAKASLEMALGKGVEELFQDPAFVPAIFKAAGANPPEGQK